jgi:sugar lactone lactonase YvrE
MLSLPAGLAFAAQPPLVRRLVSTIAGTGVAGYSGDDGPGKEGLLSNPYGLTIGPDGGLYFCEVDNHCVRRLSPGAHVLSTVAGNLRRGHSGDGGPAIEASLNRPYDVRFDALGNMYIADMQNHVIRRVDAKSQIISTIAGTGTAGFSGDGGPAIKAKFAQPHAIAFDPQKRLLICDIENNRVRRVDLKTGIIDTWLGNGHPGPTPDGAPLAGTPVQGPRLICHAEDGTLYLALRDAHSVFRLDLKAQRYVHVAGSGERGYAGDGGPAKAARLSGPKGLACASDGSLFIADTENHVIRRVDPRTGTITTILGTGERGDGPDGDPLRCKLNRPHGVYAGLRGGIYVADSENNRIRLIRLATRPAPPYLP